MKRLLSLAILGAIVAGCSSNKPQQATAPALIKPRIAVNLPDNHNTPDGMALDKQNNIILSAPNFNDNKYPAYLMKITPDDKLEEWLKLPVHPETKVACPLGIDFASDGNLYVADCQGFSGGDSANYKSRILRVTVKDNKPVKCDVVVEGMIFPNAIACFGDSVYCTESMLEPKPKTSPIKSGVYRFKLSELGDKPIKVKPAGTDPHLVYTLTTKNPEWKVGANGMGFAADGTMYVCNFGDAALNAVTFDAAGKVAAEKVVAQGGPMKSTDGLKVCPKTGCVIIADFLGNAIHCVDPKTGKVTTLAQNGHTTGANGELDKPSEPCIRDGKIYVSNIDLNLAGNTFDKPYTISVIDMPNCANPPGGCCGKCQK